MAARCLPAAAARCRVDGTQLRGCATASMAQPLSEEAGAGVEDAAEEADVPPMGMTSDMRPHKDTSRKFVKMDSLGRAYATGRRKKAIARVWVWPIKADDTASVRINKMNLSNLFGGHWAQRFMVLAPFFETGTAGKYSVMATVKGGGTTSQAQAVRLGISTALQGLDSRTRPAMKAAGYLKRDPRQRERKKPGQKGVRTHASNTLVPPTPIAACRSCANLYVVFAGTQEVRLGEAVRRDDIYSGAAVSAVACVERRRPADPGPRRTTR